MRNTPSESSYFLFCFLLFLKANFIDFNVFPS